MPSKKQYNLVHNDEYDTRIPLHSEEAFHRGIVFHAKFIGSMDVPRPTSRVEIVAAMRRIRYEFKAKGIKKKKVTLEVSVDGLKVTLRKKKKKQQWMDENKAFQMHYPIYRIFYVSHDSHDLKIFSYIARDGNSNSFKCNVFKSSKKTCGESLKTRVKRVESEIQKMLRNPGKLTITSEMPGGTGGAGVQSPGTPEPSTPGGTRPRKKLSFKEPEFFGYLRMKKPSFRAKPPVLNPPPATHQQTRVSLDELPFEEEDEDFEELQSQAMRVVRTVGQAFEVCHKLSLNTASEERDQDNDKERERNDDHLPRSEDYEDEMTNDRQPIIQPRSPSPNLHKDISILGDGEDPGQDQPTAITPCIIRTHSSASPIRQSPSGTVPSDCGDILLLGGNELTSLKHEIQLLRERLDQQGQQTRAAVAHARLLQDQLAAETAARVEAQTRTHQLLVQNKELLEHIGALVSHLRDQERTSGIHGVVQSQGAQGTNNPMNQQSPNVPDLSTLGQSHSRTGQGSPWELEPPSFTYSYTPDPLYGTEGLELGGYGASNDQLHFQTQLLERLHNISPYQTQRSPYATPSPYPMPAASFLLSPTSKPSSSQAPLRLSQANSFASSPVMPHKMPGYTSQSEDALSDLHALIKPLPCTLPRQRNSLHFARDTQDPRQQRASCPPQTMVTLDPPPQGRKTEQKKPQDSPRPQGSPARDTPTRESQSLDKNIPKSSLATILRSPGPPPSRTTSARLPARNDLISQVQRKTWARHTTK